LNLHGSIGDIADTWRRLPARQLVVIGAPAAGKTSLVVLFVQEVLAERVPGEPVPVLLNLAGWDPSTAHLDTWIARRLAADYPQLTRRRSYGDDATVRLVDRQWVIPVLDGLDEMPEALRPLAITALNQAVAGDRPLVLTCRTDEFEETIAASGTPLGRAAVVELTPLSGDTIIEYLPAGQVGGAARWSAVVAHLRVKPDGVLSRALSNPLMAYMARAIYAAADTDPGTLLTFDTVVETEEHLFGCYLPTAYRPRLPVPNEEPLRPYRAEDAERWLSYIAGQLQRRGKRNLCLWRLAELQPGFRRAAVMLLRSWHGLLAVTGGLALLAAVLVTLAWVDDASLPVLFVVALVAFCWPKPHASPTRVRVRPVRVGLGLAMVIGLGVLFGNTREVRSDMGDWERIAMVGMFALAMVPIGGLVLVGLIDAAPTKAVLSPAIALRQDREAVLAIVLASIGMLLFFPNVVTMLSIEAMVTGVVTGVALGLLSGMMFDVGYAWGNWVTGRAWLALPGLLPWRLLPFIEDAHRRGVLRAVGTEYQFRHVRLQEYLSRSG
jgi:hypothetical protein